MLTHMQCGGCGTSLGEIVYVVRHDRPGAPPVAWEIHARCIQCGEVSSGRYAYTSKHAVEDYTWTADDYNPTETT
jgi:uncharacterized Zn finger protein